MKRPEVQGALAHLAPFFIATPEQVIETLSQGFDYHFLTTVNETDPVKDIATKINETLFGRTQ
jgi:hypothetical protein